MTSATLNIHGTWPRLLSLEQLRAYLGGPEPSTIYDWRKKGIIPDVLKGTTKTDRLLVDQYLNKRSGLAHDKPLSELDEWRDKRARQHEGRQESHEAPR
jgi:hypothetical protein